MKWAITGSVYLGRCSFLYNLPNVETSVVRTELDGLKRFKFIIDDLCKADRLSKEDCKTVKKLQDDGLKTLQEIINKKVIKR